MDLSCLNELWHVPIDQIRADPARFQWRRGADAASGVPHGEELHGAWNPLIDGNPLLLYRDTDGTLYVVDGHHRLEHARELSASGQAPERLLARVLESSQGITPEAARIIGAQTNLAQEFGDPRQRHTIDKIADAAVVFFAASRHPELASVLPPLRGHPELQLARELAQNAARLEQRPHSQIYTQEALHQQQMAVAQASGVTW